MKLISMTALQQPSEPLRIIGISQSPHRAIVKVRLCCREWGDKLRVSGKGLGPGILVDADVLFEHERHLERKPQPKPLSHTLNDVHGDVPFTADFAGFLEDALFRHTIATLR